MPGRGKLMYGPPVMTKLTLILALAAVACGGRTSPATQPAPKGYDASKNDPKAVELVGKMHTALGGAENWNKVKQIQFDVKVEVKGEVQALNSHSWDRWNARHRFESTSMSSYKEAQEYNDPKRIKKSLVMYRLFERERGVGYWDGNEMPAGDRKSAVENAFTRWKADTYMLTLPYRVTDPGVYIKYDREAKDDNCPEGCDVVAVTFDPGVGQDKYWVNISKETGLPVMIEMELAASSGRMAYKIVSWNEVKGLKFPTALDNVGARNLGDSEVWSFSNVKISAPDDDLYIPRIH